MWLRALPSGSRLLLDDLAGIRLVYARLSVLIALARLSGAAGAA
jgi:hypothetical protein